LTDLEAQLNQEFTYQWTWARFRGTAKPRVHLSMNTDFKVWI